MFWPLIVSSTQQAGSALCCRCVHVGRESRCGSCPSPGRAVMPAQEQREERPWCMVARLLDRSSQEQTAPCSQIEGGQGSRWERVAAIASGMTACGPAQHIPGPQLEFLVPLRCVCPQEGAAMGWQGTNLAGGHHRHRRPCVLSEHNAGPRRVTEDAWRMRGMEPGIPCGHSSHSPGPFVRGTRDRGDRTDRRDNGMVRLGRLWLLDLLLRTSHHTDRVHSFPCRTLAPGWLVSMPFEHVSGREVPSPGVRKRQCCSSRFPCGEPVSSFFSFPSPHSWASRGTVNCWI